MKKRYYVHYTDMNCDQDCIAMVYAYNIEEAAEEIENVSHLSVSYTNTEFEESNQD